MNIDHFYANKIYHQPDKEKIFEGNKLFDLRYIDDFELLFATRTIGEHKYGKKYNPDNPEQLKAIILAIGYDGIINKEGAIELKETDNKIEKKKSSKKQSNEHNNIDNIRDNNQTTTQRDISSDLSDSEHIGNTGQLLFDDGITGNREGELSGRERLDALRSLRNYNKRPDTQDERPSSVRSPRKNIRNYIIPDDTPIIDNRIQRNLRALETLLSLKKEDREATEEEKTILNQYTGWGGITSILTSSTNGNKDLNHLLYILEEFKSFTKEDILGSIRKSILTAYYTPASVTRGIYDILERTNFTGGRILEPSMGIGNFFGTMPDKFKNNSSLLGVEIDYITGSIARLLYPDTKIRITGFQDTLFANNHFDLIIGNIPFGNLRIFDPEWKKKSNPIYRFSQQRIHNYFVVKNIELAKEGGIIAFITSSATLDTPGNDLIRKYIANKTEFLGAIRLPNTTFKSSNTEITSDILFLRKFYQDEEKKQKQNFIELATEGFTTPNNTEKHNLSYNKYFAEHPDMMLGKPSCGFMHGQYCFSLSAFGNSSDLRHQIAEKAAQIFPLKYTFGESTNLTEKPVQDILDRYSGFDKHLVRDGNLVLHNGKTGVIRERLDEDKNKQLMVEPFNFKGIKDKRIIYFIRLRTVLTELMLKELYDAPDEELARFRQRLNDEYQSFLKLFGQLNSPANRFIRSDTDGYTILALEKLDKKGNVIGLADIFEKRTVTPIKNATSADSPEQAILISLNETGKISPDKMKVLLGEEWVTLCKDLVFELPDKQGIYVTKENYLSGNVKYKLTQAQAALENDERFFQNVEALKAVQPQDIPTSLIDIRLGARWVPVNHYTDFFRHLFSVPAFNTTGQVFYNQANDTYFIERDRWSLESVNTVFAAGGENGITIGQAALQDKHLQIFTETKSGKKILDTKATQAVEEKVQEIKLAFKKWLSNDQNRLNELAKLYNDIYNSTIPAIYNGSHLTFPGYIGPVPRPHQKDAVFRILQENGCLCDQFPGSGKTLEMILAAMEMRRMGIANKPMIISLKTPVSQIAGEFKRVYPFARILAPSESDFSKKNRNMLLAKIATNDWDAVILSHEQYCQLEHDPEIKTELINEELFMLGATVEELRADGSKSELSKRQLKGLEKRINNLEAKVKEILSSPKDNFTFEKLGIDHLFVDESHEFKNLAFSTKHNNVAGLGDPAGSQKSKYLLMGCRALQKKYEGDKGITFLSGTPISNSLVELYLIFVYLRPNLLGEMGIVTLDAFASIFAERSTEFEFSVTGEFKSRDRFRRFTNVPELSTMYRGLADIRTDKNLKIPKPDLEVELVHIEPSQLQKEYMNEIILFAQTGESKKFDLYGDAAKKAKMLLATSLSAKVAMDIRLIDQNNDDEPSSKINKCAEKVAEIYRQTDQHKAVQLIFSDIGTPSEKFNVYDEIKRKLIEEYNIPENEIAFIHDASNNIQKDLLFKQVSNRDVRIMIGSTKKLGTGSNIQEWIACSHHLDVPWVPSAFEQRNGRVARQGNIYAEKYAGNKVKTYVYAVEQSLDAYKYQLLEIKQNLINQVKDGSITDRCINEGASGNNAVNFAEFVAILSGNPIILEKANIDKDIHQLLLSERIFKEHQFRIKNEINASEQRLKNLIYNTNCAEKDLLHFKEHGFYRNEDNSFNYDVIIDGKHYKKPGEAGEALLEKVKRKEYGNVLSGFGIDLYLRKGTAQNPEYMIHAPSGLTYGKKYLSLTPTHAGMAILTAIEQAERIVRKKEEIPEQERQIEILKSTVKEDWPDEDKLQKLLARQKEINDELINIEKSQKTIDIPYEEISSEIKKNVKTEEVLALGDTPSPIVPSLTNRSPDEIVSVTESLSQNERTIWLARLGFFVEYEEYKKHIEPVFKSKNNGIWNKHHGAVIFWQKNHADHFARVIRDKIASGQLPVKEWKDLTQPMHRKSAKMKI